MKKIKYLLFLFILFIPVLVNAESGSESYYGGPYDWNYENNVTEFSPICIG